MLLGNQPQAGGKLTAILEGADIAYRRHQRRCRERSNPRDTQQALALGMAVGNGVQFFIIEGQSPVQLHPFIEEIVEQLLAQRRQLVLFRVECFQHRFATRVHPPWARRCHTRPIAHAFR